MSAAAAAPTTHRARGVVAGLAVLILGLVLLSQPQATIELLAAVVGVFIVARSIFAIVEAGRRRNAAWGWRAAAGLVGLVVGILVLAQPALSAVITFITAYYILAVGAAVFGVLEIVEGLHAPRTWALVLTGVLQILLAFVFMLYPAAGSQILVQILGALAAALGLVMLGRAVTSS